MIADALREAAAALAKVSDAPRREAEWLMAHVLGTAREAMLLSRMRDTPPADFARLLARRLQGEPLAHILGRQPFYGLDLKVSRDVLIPRADSETLIDAARAERIDPKRILDLGTGSGALLLAALSIWPDAQGIGIDASDQALAIARANAQVTGIGARAGFDRRDWHLSDWREGLGRFDLVLANPPYVAADDPDLAADVGRYEPAAALFAGPDGLDAYRRLIPDLPALLADGAVAFFEIGMRQAAAVRAIAKSAGLASELFNDAGGRPRAIRLRG